MIYANECHHRITDNRVHKDYNLVDCDFVRKAILDLLKMMPVRRRQLRTCANAHETRY